MEDKKITEILKAMRLEERTTKALMRGQIERISNLAEIGRKLKEPKWDRDSERYICPECSGKLLVNDADGGFWRSFSHPFHNSFRYFKCGNENCDYEYADYSSNSGSADI